jgi:tetratricopeptide (TPR) repeat protein
MFELIHSQHHHNDQRVGLYLDKELMMFASVLLGILLAFPAPDDSAMRENPLAMDPAMREFAHKVGFGLLPMQRLQALVDAIFQNKELNFSYAPISRSAGDTFKNRNGNCLSFTFLFISMARYLGMDARFCEVNIPPEFTKKGDRVILIQHLKPVVYIEGEAYAIDIFPAIIPIGMDGQIVSDERGFAHFFSNKGVVEFSNSNYELADAYFTKALDLDSTTVGAWINLGAARFQTGKLEEAERCYKKALALNPKSPAAMNNLANIFEITGRVKEAFTLKKKIQQFREKNPYYHFDLGLQACRQGDNEKALAHFRRAAKLNSRDYTFYFEIARMYARIGKKKQMLSNLQLAIKYASEPDNKLKYAQKLEALKSNYSQAD